MCACDICVRESVSRKVRAYVNIYVSEAGCACVRVRICDTCVCMYLCVCVRAYIVAEALGEPDRLLRRASSSDRAARCAVYVCVCLIIILPYLLRH